MYNIIEAVKGYTDKKKRQRERKEQARIDAIRTIFSLDPCTGTKCKNCPYYKKCKKN